MKLEPAQEREPVDTLLLVRSQNAVALERQLKVLNLAVVQERLKESSVILASLHLLCGKLRRGRTATRER